MTPKHFDETKQRDGIPPGRGTEGDQGPATASGGRADGSGGRSPATDADGPPIYRCAHCDRVFISELAHRGHLASCGEDRAPAAETAVDRT